jgi:Saxitoxin biosynthesis operon protein SxtJ
MEGISVSNNPSLHEDYRDDERAEAGSNRAFGCTVGTILIVIGTAKALVAGAIFLVPCLIFVAGAILFLVGVVAPSRLSALHGLWLSGGAAIAKVVNPVVLALLFFLLVTPMAFVMRVMGKRPLRLQPDRTVSTYWINREPPAGGAPSMRQQF